MKVAVPVLEILGMESPVSSHFGRSPYFAIYDTDSGELRFIENPMANAPRGAGSGTAVRVVASNGVSLVIVSNIGPKAVTALRSLGIEIRYVKPGITLREALLQAGFRV